MQIPVCHALRQALRSVKIGRLQIGLYRMQKQVVRKCATVSLWFWVPSPCECNSYKNYHLPIATQVALQKLLFFRKGKTS